MLRFVLPSLIMQDVGKLPKLRLIVKVSKLIQNSASNIRFGEKEMGMTKFNEFIHSNEKRMKRILRMLYQNHKSPTGSSSQLELLSNSVKLRMLAERNKEYVDSLVLLREHLLRSPGFLPRYMAHLERQKNATEQLKVPATLLLK